MPSLVPRLDRRVWMLLVAMLVFKFGQGLYYPFSTIYLLPQLRRYLALPRGCGSCGPGRRERGLGSRLRPPYRPLRPQARDARRPLGERCTFRRLRVCRGILGIPSGLRGGGPRGRYRLRRRPQRDGRQRYPQSPASPGARLGSGWRQRRLGFRPRGGQPGRTLCRRRGDHLPHLFTGTTALTLAVLLSLALLVRESAPKIEERDLSAIPLSKLRAALSDTPFVVLLAVGFFLYYTLVVLL